MRQAAVRKSRLDKIVMYTRRGPYTKRGVVNVAQNSKTAAAGPGCVGSWYDPEGAAGPLYGSGLSRRG